MQQVKQKCLYWLCCGLWKLWKPEIVYDVQGKVKLKHLLGFTMRFRLGSLLWGVVSCSCCCEVLSMNK